MMNHLILTLLLLAAPLSVWAQRAAVADLADPAQRAREVNRLRTGAEATKTSAWQRARAEGWTPRGRDGGRLFELQEFDKGLPKVYIEENVNAAISTAANLVRQTPPYNLNGTGVTVGVWDGGGVRSTHRELGGRVAILDGAAIGDHATHVGGTIGASGVTATALGMAPRVRIDSYEWTSDVAEMTAGGMVTNAQAGRLPLSNHSYGYISGWYYNSSTATWYWYGIWGYRESHYFGCYDSSASDWDTVAYNAPYFLPFKSAGNDRSDTAPAAGTTFNYYNGGWLTKTYDALTDPYNDGWDSGGYDTISTAGVAKNVLTVGAVNDAVSGGLRSLPNASMTSFSCWGPADDGRIKPDVVANGASLNSSIGSSDSAYGISSGTSMSTPNACGSAALLVEHFVRLSTGRYPRASTVKGLILHTADDLGNAGPDYVNGWGLMNTKAAADLLLRHYSNPGAYHIDEHFVSATEGARTNLVRWDGTNALRVTLCWTDPPNAAQFGVDITNRMLINNLDLRVVGPTAVTSLPYVLNRTNPTALATTADNNVDNVEQVYLASPGLTGIYAIVIAADGALSGTTQHYSLLVSGVLPALASTNPVSLTVTGLPFQVGTVLPGYGTASYAPGILTQGVAVGRATNVDAVSRAIYACTGWVGSGSVPAAGAGTNTGPFTLSVASTLTWQWVMTDLTASNQVVTGALTNQPRDTLILRDGYRLQAPAQADQRAGQWVRLEDGFHAATGAEVRVRAP
jgi:hypothetical protein